MKSFGGNARIPAVPTHEAAGTCDPAEFLKSTDVRLPRQSPNESLISEYSNAGFPCPNTNFRFPVTCNHLANGLRTGASRMGQRRHYERNRWFAAVRVGPFRRNREDTGKGAVRYVSCRERVHARFSQGPQGPRSRRATQQLETDQCRHPGNPQPELLVPQSTKSHLPIHC